MSIFKLKLFFIKLFFVSYDENSATASKVFPNVCYVHSNDSSRKFSENSRKKIFMSDTKKKVEK